MFSFLPRTGGCLLAACTAIAASRGVAAVESSAAPGARFGLGPNPTAEQISRVQVFDRPLLPTRVAAEGENRVLVAALDQFARREVRDDFSSLLDFLQHNPNSAWSQGLEAQLGNEYYRVGRYSKAMAAWKHVWESGRNRAGEDEAVPANHSGSELALMYSRLGRMSELRTILNELDGRRGRGLIERHLVGARDGLWSMEYRPEVSFRCGPLALDRICFATDRAKAGNQLIQDSHSGTNGFSASEVAAISRQLGMNYRVAFRQPGAEILLPAVVHWKVGHYAALIQRDGELIRADDPTFGNKTWLSDAALDEEASGYFLVPPGALPKGWREVASEEADRVYGKGTTYASDQDESLDESTQTCRDPNPNHDYVHQVSRAAPGLAHYNVHLLLASQHVEDTPVGYTPPVGPPIYIRLSYTSVNGWPDYGLRYSNVSQEWRLNWLVYLIDDPKNPAGDVRFSPSGGGMMTFTDYDSSNQVFRALFRNQTRLVRTATNSYALYYPDGTKLIFDQQDSGLGTTRRIFMSALIDPAGNAVTLQYDSPGRLAGITDAIGQVTRFYYERPLTNEYIPPVLAWVAPYIITRVVDPFGRTATFDYTSTINARLASVTDSIGLTSSFAYKVNSNGMVTLTTPYGTTTFSNGIYNGIYRANWVEITLPNGEKERVEYSEKTPASVFSTEPLSIVPKGVPVRNFILWARNTYYWDRKAYAEGYALDDYSKARIYHWTHGQDYNTASGSLESYKEPLEHRVWFNYDGQVNATFVGSTDKPTKIARTLEDGTTQLHQFEYNSLGNPTQSIDPLGRTFAFDYDPNEIDVVAVRQTRAGRNDLLLSAAYNAQHRPLTITDASGQTTRFSYNARGQLLGWTNALGDTFTYTYDANGYLLAADGPLPGTNDTTRFTYDNIGRVRTLTDPEGYRVTIDYDAADRLTRITYPDATYEEVTYNRLDPEIIRDRAGRLTRLTHDNLRQLTMVEDALGRITRFQWCGCGGLSALVDPMGRITTWERDLEGRVKNKFFPDGTRLAYEYDGATGWLKSIRDQQNQVKNYTYNIDGTLREKRYFNAKVATAPVSFSYDPDYRRLLSMTDGVGTTTYAYNPVSTVPGLGAGRLASVDGPLPNDTLFFAYDALGRARYHSVESAGVELHWDQAGRLTQVTNLLGSFNYGWDGANWRPATATYPNGQTTEYAYHPLLRDRYLQRITHRLANGSILSEFTQDYDVLGRMTNWNQAQGGAIKSWLSGYDAADRLLSVAESSPSAPSHAYNFGYDAADNRTFEDLDGSRTQFHVNAGNQLVGVSNSPVAAMSFAWDAENRVVAITNGTHISQFTYDGWNRRTRVVERESGAIVSDIRNVWIGAGLAEERDSSGAVVLKRHFPQGMKSESGASLPPGNYYYTRDHLSSVRELTDSGGAIRAQYSYSPYGQQQRIAGTAQADIGFTGHPVHPFTGLNLAAYRLYDARLGRWLARDPIGERGGLNLYAYVHNDPFNRIDPLGLDDEVAEAGDAPASPDFFSWENAKQLLDKAVHKFGPKSVKVGPVDVSIEKPEISIGTGVDVEVEGQKIVSVEGECGVGITTEGTAKDELFYARWEVKVKTILSKIPIIGKKFEFEQSGEVKFGKIGFDPGAVMDRAQINQGINPRTGETIDGPFQ